MIVATMAKQYQEKNESVHEWMIKEKVGWGEQLRKKNSGYFSYKYPVKVDNRKKKNKRSEIRL